MLTVFALLAVLLVLLVWRTLRKWNVAANNTFQLVDLFMENDRASKGAVVLLGAFAATTWFFVYYALLGKMTEGYFGLYAGVWVSPIIAKIINGAPSVAASSPSSSVTTTTETTVKP